MKFASQAAGTGVEWVRMIKIRRRSKDMQGKASGAAGERMGRGCSAGAAPSRSAG